MDALDVTVLGPPVVAWRGTPLTGCAPKHLALICFLALQETPVSRERVTELFWESGLAGNLRTALHGLRALPGAGEWLRAGEKLELHARTDLAAFEEELKHQRYAEALERWNKAGASRASAELFMSGFALKSARPFNDWLEVERARVRELHLDCLQRRAEELTDQHRHAEAFALFRELLRLDPLNEWVHRELMRLEWLRNRPDLAVRQFESCRRALAEQLGLEPSTATLSLRDEILLGMTNQRPPLATAKAPSSSQPTLGLLVGRDQERRELAALLAGNRLVSVVGLGGVGKTLLARHLAESIADRYQDGVHFVALAALADADFLAPTIASSFGLQLSASSLTPPETQLIEQLKDKQLLLLLDNLEQLLTGVGLLDDVLRRCPGITILATTREVLELPQEVVHHLTGLPFPSEASQEPAEEYDAVKLFITSARRTVPTFGLTSHNRDQIVAICRLVEGLPLGLELAAAWVDVMPVAEIAAELTASLARTDAAQESAERHRSLRATLDASWRLLSRDEQEALATLSVFRGGFERVDAERIGGATLRTLLGLVRKSLLRRRGTGRFEMHDLVRQFALAQLPHRDEVQAAHGQHFVSFLQRTGSLFNGPSQQHATQSIDSELANVRVAWQWAVQARDHAALASASEALFRYYDIRSLNVEAYRAFSAAAEAVTDQQAAGFEGLRERLLIRQAFFANRLARYEEARELLTVALEHLEPTGRSKEVAFAYAVLGAVDYQQGRYSSAHSNYGTSLQIYAAAQDRWGTGVAHDGLGTTAFAQGEYAVAAEHYRRSLNLAEGQEDPWGTVRGLKNLGMIMAVTGEYLEARSALLRAVAICRQTDDQRALAGSLNNLGLVEQLLGELDASARSLEESGRIRQRIGDSWGSALAGSNLGAVRAAQGKRVEAKSLYRDALSTFERIGNRSGSLLSHNRLGGIALEESDDASALGHFRAALGLAQRTGEWAGASTALVGLAGLLIAPCPGKAVELLTVVQAEPASEHNSVTRSRRLLQELARSVPAELYALSQQRAANLSAEGVVAELVTNSHLATLRSFRSWASLSAVAPEQSASRRDQLAHPD